MTDPKPTVGQQAETEVSYCCERLHTDGWHVYLSHADREKVLDYVRGDQGSTRLVRVETTRTVEIRRSVYGDGRIEEVPVASPVTPKVNTPEVALAILRTGVENALGFYQVTHIHSFLREALKACEREPLTEADEESTVTLSEGQDTQEKK